MTLNDYKKFVYKVDQLNKLIKLINNSPEKYKLFINSKTHDDVVQLAAKWGFQIGSRWGES
tara:strand:- start:4071 stop:4253 length:183 start_codon:yes stop_codon:yes gene_type:complete